MATSLASQLQAIKSFIQVDTETVKRPFTRPSVLFDSKEAADIDLDTIFTIAHSGLDALVAVNERFANYKTDIFSPKSKELDRESQNPEENSHIDASVASYLRLLSGYLHLPAALKTLEYLIRRYKIHFYNYEQLILCALPYHDTHTFVRIVQLINFGNSKWRFLDGVKTSGAAPPRNVIVQQCIRDMGVLDAVIAYASPVKKHHPSKPAVIFCTTLIIEVLGSLNNLESDTVQRIIPFVISGLRSGLIGDQELKAGSLMIICFIASKVSLAPKLIKCIVRSIAELAQENAIYSSDVQWCKLYLMALINIIQLQSFTELPIKIVKTLLRIRDFEGIILGLVEDFNVDRFLAIFLKTLVAHSSDDSCHHALISLISAVPAKGFVDLVVSKMLTPCLKSSDKAQCSTAATSDSGVRAKQILVEINKRYPHELKTAVHKFMETAKIQNGRRGNILEIICKMLDGEGFSSAAVSDLKIWLAIDHPKPEVRRTALSGLTKSAIVDAHQCDSQNLVMVQDAVLQQLRDYDLTVIKGALSIDGLSDIVMESDLFEALHGVLCRCAPLLMGAPHETQLAIETAFICLEHAASSFQNNLEYSSRLASMIFPLLLILTKTRKLNMKALHLAKASNWPFYQNIVVDLSTERDEAPNFSAINMDTITCFAEAFLAHPKENVSWIVKSCNDFESSKTIFFLIVMRSLEAKHDFSQFLTLYDTCMPFMKIEWDAFESTTVAPFKEFAAKMDCKKLLEQLSDTDPKAQNGHILFHLLFRFAEALVETMPSSVQLGNAVEWSNKFKDLFIFLTSSKSKLLFRKKLSDLISGCKAPPVSTLTSFFTDEGVFESVQVESLHCFSDLCSILKDGLPFQLLAEFPSILVPLCSDSQDVRLAAMGCIVRLCILSERYASGTGTSTSTDIYWNYFRTEVLSLIVEQKGLILSDKNSLSSLLTSVMGPQSENFIIPQNVGPRFNQETKDEMLSYILAYALRLSPHGKFKILSLLKGMGNAVMHVKGVDSLQSDLLKRRAEHHLKLNRTFQKLSEIDINILCHLLESCAIPATGYEYSEKLLEALEIGATSSDDSAIIEPSITVLNNLKAPLYDSLPPEMQERLLLNVIHIFCSGNYGVQSAAREAISQIKIKCSSVTLMLNCIIDLKSHSACVKHGKKKKKDDHYRRMDIVCSSIGTGYKALAFISSLFDIILLKKDMENRGDLLAPLFLLLKEVFSEEWISNVVDPDAKWTDGSSGAFQSNKSYLAYIQQTLLLIVEEIISALTIPIKDDLLKMIDVKWLVETTHLVTDTVTRNHIFSVLSSITRVSPDNVLQHMVMIMKAIGDSTIAQVDTYSQRVFEGLISTIVPCWLSKQNDGNLILEIFVDILPELAEHRRLPIIINILSTLGESQSLASLPLLLFRSLIARKGTQSADTFVSDALGEWEYNIIVQVYDQYSCSVWLPSLALLLQKIRNHGASETRTLELVLAIKFCFDRLQDTEIVFKLKSGGDTKDIQRTLGELMEEVVSLSLFYDSIRPKTGKMSIFEKDLKEDMRILLKTITRAMIPASYFNTIIKLLGHDGEIVRNKALIVLCETIKDRIMVNVSGRRNRKAITMTPWLHADESTLQPLEMLCLQIVRLVDNDSSSTSLKLSAVLAIEALAALPLLNQSIFGKCLTSISKSIDSPDMHVALCCLRAAGALINQLGPIALSELPVIMHNILKRFRCSGSKNTDHWTSPESVNLSESFKLAVLDILTVVIDKLGSFLNPYLVDIIELLVLYPDFVSKAHPKLRSRAESVRKLFAEKIIARLALPPITKVYSAAVISGDSSITVIFEMLTNLINVADRTSIKIFHAEIFDVCLLGLGIRRQHPESIQNVADVETIVIYTLVSLTKKLTETMFKPLFFRSIEWAQLDAGMSSSSENGNLEKAISFYALVTRLSKDLGSPFVPYFKYLLGSCVCYLGNDENGSIKRKRKKVKVQDASTDSKDDKSSVAIQKWHLRALILSSLFNCFLHDSDKSKFLDKANFDALLEPIVSQLDVDPPMSLDEHPEVPSVQQVDDLLVMCVGQMAVGAGTDTLWKELNNRVLMQTRSEKIRARILGLKIVKYLTDSLKEEYLVLLPETIPFLGELLEDVELPVKTLAKEVCRELEALSKEDLSQYLK